MNELLIEVLLMYFEQCNYAAEYYVALQYSIC